MFRWEFKILDGLRNFQMAESRLKMNLAVTVKKKIRKQSGNLCVVLIVQLTVEMNRKSLTRTLRFWPMSWRSKHVCVTCDITTMRHRLQTLMSLKKYLCNFSASVYSLGFEPLQPFISSHNWKFTSKDVILKFYNKTT